MILPRIGLALTALAACSATAALLARGRRAVPATADLPLALIAAAIAAVFAAALPWGRALAAAAALGAVAALPGAPFRAREARTDRSPADEGTGWKRFARRMGNFQSRLLLGAVYFVLLAPFALFSRFSADPLAPPEGPSRWRQRSDPAADLVHARRQS